MQKGKTAQIIADELDEDMGIVIRIYKEIEKQADAYNVDKVYKEVFSE